MNLDSKDSSSLNFNIDDEKERLGEFIDVWGDSEYYSWTMSTETIISLSEKFGVKYSYLGDKEDTYNYLTNNMMYNNQSSSEKLVFYPQSPKNSSKKYSVLNLYSAIGGTELETEVQSGLNDFDKDFPRRKNQSPSTDLFSFEEAVKTFPRMTVMKSTSEPTRLDLTLKFYEVIDGNDYELDVNNGIKNNELKFTFYLHPDKKS